MQNDRKAILHICQHKAQLVRNQPSPRHTQNWYHNESPSLTHRPISTRHSSIKPLSPNTHREHICHSPATSSLIVESTGPSLVAWVRNRQNHIKAKFKLEILNMHIYYLDDCGSNASSPSKIGARSNFSKNEKKKI